jgi:DNA-binding HxlR family transcriptional regulator
MDMTSFPDIAVKPETCTQVSEILGRLGDKWVMLAITVLREEPCRFNDLRRKILGISQQMLTRTLRTLERDGLVSRTVYPTVPPQVEYSLTALGRSLSDPVMALGRWALSKSPEIALHRQGYDAAMLRPRR